MAEQGTPVTPSTPNNGKAVAALVLGIVSIVFCWVYGIVGLITGIIGIVLAISAKKEAPSSMCTAGMVLSIIGLCLNALIFISCIACAGAIFSAAPWAAAHSFG
jgi:uncharacterized membrane protein HdeD (DUF308 family)